MDHICHTELVADHFYLYHTSNTSTSNQHRPGFQNQVTEGASEISEGALALMHIYFDISYFVQSIDMIIIICDFKRESPICHSRNFAVCSPSWSS